MLHDIEPPPPPRRKRVFWNLDRVAKMAIIFQLFLVIGVSVAFAVVTNHQNDQLAAQTSAVTKAALDQSRSNHQIIQQLQQDLFIHARASSDRSCAIARNLQYLVGLSPDLKQHVSDRVTNFTISACKFVPPVVNADG